jgi:beta-lactamase regulating signal transducer with metallopeptidase domain
MSLDLALRNLAAWSLQAGVLALAAAALSRLVPVERPAARLALGQGLLFAVLLLPLLQPWPAAAGAVTWSIGPALPLGKGGAALSAAAPAPLRWPPIAALVLLAGAAVSLSRLVLGLARLRSLRRAGRPLEAPPWLAEARSRLAPRASFVVSGAVGSPATFGLRRPVVLLPTDFGSLPRERQEAMALHELEHVRRGDWAFVVLEELLRAALFFHPAVHWLVSRVRLAREQTVDAAVVRRLGAPEVYLHSLVDAARLAARARAVPAAPFLRESHLRERVDLLLKGVAMSRARAAAHVSLTAALLVLAFAWVSSAVPLVAVDTPHAAVTVADEPIAPPSEPRLVHKVNPAYPEDARAEGVEGVFLVNLTIGRDGAISGARVAASAPTPERLSEIQTAKGRAKWTPADQQGDARLAQAALDAVNQWRYQPMLKDGKPVNVEATVTVRFKLQ